MFTTLTVLGFNYISKLIILAHIAILIFSNQRLIYFFSILASIASVATPFGCFLSGPISDKFGRRTALIWINIVGLIGWIVIAIAYHFPEKQYSILLLGRVITGLSTGLSSMPASVYMAEVSSSKLRGVFTTWSAIFFSLGVLVVYGLGYFMKVSGIVKIVY